ncbi:chemotaxis protein CheB [Sphingomonas crocodyli]|uniref:protein-glutamate methylesterase n=1 Tax=Sphingomonas crocodyli TaxID=1979270 RepID=A0A437LYI8_9SPHN|nr:chemotaxis protein CheB [Sphingomonas crocodyli]RVT90416.1 chemotaxis protein CheB [Sphingomonas crocodyli]
MTRPIEAIVVGASAGAVQALSRLLPNLPATYPLPILVVVHVPPERSELATLFGAKCRLRVKDAEDKESIRPGYVYFAPSDYHLLVEDQRTLALSVDEPVLYSRPSVDILFESAADAFGDAVAGIILTGANEDGAAGLAAIANAGGRAIVQQPHEAFASAMPLAALARCPQAEPLTLDAIARQIEAWAS